VPTLAFPLKAFSDVWKKVRRTLKNVARAFVESRMHSAQFEIDRYQRTHAASRRRFEAKSNYWPVYSLDKGRRGQRRLHSLLKGQVS
jgi:hypothetical protein